jgi:hypothetical protein
MRCFRRRSPIEQMTDQACGFQGPEWMQVYIIYRCPKCKKRHQTEAEEVFPDDTAVIEFECPDCCPELNSGLKFFDKDGNLIGIGSVDEQN